MYYKEEDRSRIMLTSPTFGGTPMTVTSQKHANVEREIDIAYQWLLEGESRELRQKQRHRYVDNHLE